MCVCEWWAVLEVFVVFDSIKLRNSNRYNRRSMNQMHKSKSDAEIHVMIQWLLIGYMWYIKAMISYERMNCMSMKCMSMKNVIHTICRLLKGSKHSDIQNFFDFRTIFPLPNNFNISESFDCCMKSKTTLLTATAVKSQYDRDEL